MNSDILTLLEDIINTAKAKGWDQKDLAGRAQINVSSLSRAKKNKDIKFSTLQALAHCVGLKLVLVPDSSVAEKILKGGVFQASCRLN